MGGWRRSPLLLATIVLAGACGAGHASSAPMAPKTTAVTSACSTPARVGPLPTWARAGFSPPSQSMPYVLGQNGEIVAILWATRSPLEAPPLADHNNKILWVSRVSTSPGSSLQIRATLTGSGRTVTREVAGGPGPSYVNLPVAGCWALDLDWSGHHDRVDLRYT